MICPHCVYEGALALMLAVPGAMYFFRWLRSKARPAMVHDCDQHEADCPGHTCEPDEPSTFAELGVQTFNQRN